MGGGRHLKNWVSTTELGRPGWLDHQHPMHLATIFIVQIILFPYEEVSYEDELTSLQRSCFSLNKSRELYVKKKKVCTGIDVWYPFTDSRTSE